MAGTGAYRFMVCCPRLEFQWRPLFTPSCLMVRAAGLSRGGRTLWMMSRNGGGARAVSASAGSKGEGKGSPVWGLVADTHFKEKDLGSIEATGEWVVKGMREAGVTRAFILGDLLNTRSTVSVRAQSAALNFVDRLHAEVGSVHVLLGNHDMHLRHSRRVSSLDALGMQSLFGGEGDRAGETPRRLSSSSSSLSSSSSSTRRVYLHRDPEVLEIDGTRVLMVPYHESVEELKEVLDAYRDEETVVMGHFSCGGAVQNVGRGTKYVGPMGIDWLGGYKRSFSGHFHFHQTMRGTSAGESSRGSLTYVGSPMQFTFGDLGDDQRGFLVYSPEEDEFRLNVNPGAERFVRVDARRMHDWLVGKNKKRREQAAAAIKADKEVVEGKYVMLKGVDEWLEGMGGGATTRKGANLLRQLKDELVAKGALNVRVKDTMEPLKPGAMSGKNLGTRSVEGERSGRTFLASSARSVQEEVERFAKTQEGLEEMGMSAEKLGRVAAEVVKVSRGEEEAAEEDSRPVFEADLAAIEMENFMGVQGLIRLDIGAMDDGVWYVTGPNGSGKSTVGEAVTWCLFGEFLRSDMRSDFAMNDVRRKGCRVRVEYANGVAIERWRMHADLGKGGVRVLRVDDDSRLSGGVKAGLDMEGAEEDKGSFQDQQAVVERLVGTDFDTYSRTAVLTDGTMASFLAARSGDRRALIEKLLGLGDFDGYLETCRRMRRELGREADAAEGRVEQFRVVAEQMWAVGEAKRQEAEDAESMIAEVKQRMVEAQERKEREVIEAEAELTRCQERVEEAVRERERVNWVVAAQRLSERARREDEALQVKLDRAELERERAEAAVEDAKKRLNDSVRELENVAGRRDSLQAGPLAENDVVLTHLAEAKGGVEILTEAIPFIDNEARRAQASGGLERVSQALEKIRQVSVTDVSASSAAGDDLSAAATLAQSEEVSEAEEIVQGCKARVKHLEAELERLRSDLNAKVEEASSSADRARSALAAEARQLLQIEQGSETAANLDELLCSLDSRLDALEVSLLDVEAEALRANQDASDASLALSQAKVRMESAKRGDAAIEAAVLAERAERLADQRARCVAEALEADGKADEAKNNGEREFSEVLQPMLERDATLVWLEKQAFGRASGNVASKPTRSSTLREWLLADSVDQLNSSIATCLAALSDDGVDGMHELQVALGPDFSLVEAGGVDFGKRSGGQRKRTALAIFFGLVSLSRLHGRHRHTTLILDEVFDALDEAGQDAAHRLVDSFLRTESHGGDQAAMGLRRALVVTHSALAGGSSERVVRVRMTPRGTTLEFPGEQDLVSGSASAIEDL